jgi:Holliday junction DNA helicase RuvB
MVRPVKFDEIVGQKDAKTVIEILLKASKIKDDAIPHILCSGPAGNGKTTVAKCAAEARGTRLYEINAANINTVNELKSIINGMKDKEILFIDEIHNLKDKVCEWLYTVMEDFKYYEKAGDSVITKNIAKITIFGASTCIGRLPEPLKARFKFKAEFVPYTEDELCQIVELVCRSYNFKLNNNIAHTIAKTCRLTPRLVVGRTEWIRDYMIAGGLRRLSEQDVINIIGLQGIDKDGLTKIDHTYLDVIKECSPISLVQIANKINVDKDTVANDIEPYLIKCGLIEVTTKGRILGKNYGKL